MPEPVSAFALAAIVLVVAALAAGLVERAPVSFPMIFLGLGLRARTVGLRFTLLAVAASAAGGALLAIVGVVGGTRRNPRRGTCRTRPGREWAARQLPHHPVVLYCA